MPDPTTSVYPKPGVTVYLPGGVHGFSSPHRAVPMAVEHARALGHALETEAQRKAARDLAAARAEQQAADRSF